MTVQSLFNFGSCLKLSLLSSAILLAISPGFAQTKVGYHPNKVQPSEDVTIGERIALETEQKFTVLRNEEVVSYLSEVGNRLVRAIPAEFQHPEFRYSFRVVDSSSRGMLALPGGPLYLDRGLLASARNEGELAGVFAHGLSHIVLRHGTADATKEYLAQLMLNSIPEKARERKVVQTAQSIANAALAAHLQKLARGYETEADVLAAQIVARAGYDPRDLANLFRGLEKNGDSPCAGLEPAAEYPLQVGRYKRIEQEALYLRVVNPISASERFDRFQANLRR